MSIANLLDRLLEESVKVSVKEGRLLLVSPSGKIPQDVEQQVRSNKAALLEYFKRLDDAAKQVSGPPEILSLDTIRENLCYRQENWWRAVRVGRGFSPVATGFTFEGEYRQETLLDTFNTLAGRHKILKATFSIKGDSLYQEISDAPLVVEFKDLSGRDRQAAQTEISRMCERISRFPHIAGDDRLGATRQSLFCGGCARLGNNLIFVYLCVDHIISDGYSLKILADEFREIYRALMESRLPDLPELPFQYLDYVAWSNSLNAQDSEFNRRCHAFWKKHCDSLTVTRLAHEYQLTAKGSNEYQSEYIRFGISQPLTREFVSICRARKYPVFSAFITLFFVTVSRFMGQANPTIATILSGRDKLGTENLVGSFAEMVYAKLDIPKEISYGNLISECNGILNDIHENLFIDWTGYLREEISASYIAKDEKIGSGRKSSGPATGFAFSIEPGVSISEDQMVLYSEECTFARSKASYTSANFIWFRVLGYEERILCSMQYETRHFSREKMCELITLFKDTLGDFCGKQKHSGAP